MKFSVYDAGRDCYELSGSNGIWKIGNLALPGLDGIRAVQRLEIP